MDDELQEVRDNFYIGNYQKAFQLCEATTGLNDVAQSECDATYARACLAMGMYDKLKAMQNSECPGQKAAALTAVLTKSKNEQQRQQAKERLVTLAKETVDMSSAALAACMLAADGSWQEAVAMTQAHPTMEMQAMHVFFLLMCNQVDQAEKRMTNIAGQNDDSATFRLAQAAVHIATGNAEEAYLICCDLAAQYPTGEGEEGSQGSALLLTCKGVANMHRGMFNEALEDLQRALALAPNDPDVLVNMCSCMINLSRKEEFQQHYAKLEQVAPTHPYVVKTQSLKTGIARFKASLTA
mmetsp:Transcript_33323/g.61093  ORF Transcript_33323/g.61093 Transcript_33323/m.61093 type:complete len:297 (-) Transcript_33323:106-996(-)